MPVQTFYFASENSHITACSQCGDTKECKLYRTYALIDGQPTWHNTPAPLCEACYKKKAESPAQQHTPQT